MKHKLLIAGVFCVAIGLLIWPSKSSYAFERPVTNQELIQEAFPDAPVMLRIAEAESSLASRAKNPASTASGLFQILKSTWDSNGCLGEPFVASDNIACAKILYSRYGTTPWNASKSKWSL